MRPDAALRISFLHLQRQHDSAQHSGNARRQRSRLLPRRADAHVLRDARLHEAFQAFRLQTGHALQEAHDCSLLCRPHRSFTRDHIAVHRHLLLFRQQQRISERPALLAGRGHPNFRRDPCRIGDNRKPRKADGPPAPGPGILPDTSHHRRSDPDMFPRQLADEHLHGPFSTSDVLREYRPQGKGDRSCEQDRSQDRTCQRARLYRMGKYQESQKCSERIFGGIL